MLFSGPKAGWAASGISRLLLGQLSSVLSSAAGGPAQAHSTPANVAGMLLASCVGMRPGRVNSFYATINPQGWKPSRLNPPAHCQYQCPHTHCTWPPRGQRRANAAAAEGAHFLQRSPSWGRWSRSYSSGGRGAGDGVATRTSFTTSNANRKSGLLYRRRAPGKKTRGVDPD